MILPNRPALLIATTMSAIMLVGSSSPSLVPATAFAQRDGGSTDNLLRQLLNLDSNNENNIAENEVGHNSVIVDPTTIQQISVQTAANVNTDNDVYIVLGCHDGNVKISDNDKVTQVSEQAANQEALSDSDGPTIQQTSVQTAANHNEDNDRTVYIGSLNL